MAKEIMEIRMSVGIMYSTRRTMYLTISYLLLPSPTLLTGDVVLLRVGGTRLRVKGCIVHVRHVVEVVLHDAVALRWQLSTYDVELLLSNIQDLTHYPGLLILVDRGVQLVVQLHLTLGRLRGLHTALPPGEIPLGPGYGEVGFIAEREVPPPLNRDVLPAAVPGP